MEDRSREGGILTTILFYAASSQNRMPLHRNSTFWAPMDHNPHRDHEAGMIYCRELGEGEPAAIGSKPAKPRRGYVTVRIQQPRWALARSNRFQYAGNSGYETSQF